MVSGFGTPAAADMGMLRSAVRDNRRLALAYRDERERLTERTCLPLAVIYYIEVTVLAAWCELRDDFRHLRADRIVACRETGDSFADMAPQLRRDWRARRGMPRQGRDGGQPARVEDLRPALPRCRPGSEPMAEVWVGFCCAS